MHDHTRLSVTAWLVEDDQDDQYLMRMAFSQHIPPIKLNILQDGDEVIPALQLTLTAPKLILMDINMQRQNGFETLQQVRNRQNWAHLPIIIFSTSDTLQDKRRAYEVGATGFITKPSDFSSLTILVQQLVQEWRLTESVLTD